MVGPKVMPMAKRLYDDIPPLVVVKRCTTIYRNWY